jgi:type I restriction enzyme S subunit
MDVGDDELKKFCLTAGDIVFARTGATVGKLAVIRDGDPACIAGAYFIRIRLKEAAEPDYIATALRSRSIQSIIVSGSHQSAQQNFSGPGLRALLLPIPPTDIQRQFSSASTAVAEHAVPSTRAASELDQLFASLESRAFSGQL